MQITIPPITLITGPRESGRTTYAVLVASQLYRQGVTCFNNGTALIGCNIEAYLGEADGLLKVAQGMPSEATTLIIEEADIQQATCQSNSLDHDTAIEEALRILAGKGCYLILTTTEGNEGKIAQRLLQNVYQQVNVRMFAESKDNVSLMSMHRLGKYRIPLDTMEHDPEEVIRAMLVANPFKEMRSGASDGIPVNYTEDDFFPVAQTSIDEMQHPKHPEYPVYYRYRTIRRTGENFNHSITKDALLFFTWLESVNEHPNETVALRTVARTMPQWGFEYQPISIPQDDHFPDGQAYIDGELTNLEVVSIQPRYPSGHNLHTLVALSQVGRAAQPENEAILDCRTCKSRSIVPGVTKENLPEHDNSHQWVLYLPGPSYGENCDSEIAVTPTIDITQEGFTAELRAALQTKSEVIEKQGQGRKNWVIVLAQGFPIEPAWYDDLGDDWPDNIDGIVVVATEMYAGAFSLYLPYHDYTALLLKCPNKKPSHNCYHPGYGFRFSALDKNYQSLSPATHSVEDVSYDAFHHDWPSDPVKRTLVVRDEYGNVLDSREGLDITPHQAREFLSDSGYYWKKMNEAHHTLLSEQEGNPGRFWAEIKYSDEEAWIGLVHLDLVTAEAVFTTLEMAKDACEVKVVTAIAFAGEYPGE